MASFSTLKEGRSQSFSRALTHSFKSSPLSLSNSLSLSSRLDARMQWPSREKDTLVTGSEEERSQSINFSVNMVIVEVDGGCLTSNCVTEQLAKSDVVPSHFSID